MGKDPQVENDAAPEEVAESPETETETAAEEPSDKAEN